MKDGTTIVFTSEMLKREAAKEGRAHTAVLRLFVDKKDKIISFTNPLYFGKAFMQNDYKDAVFRAEYDAINKEFRGLKDSKDRARHGKR